MLKSCVLYTSFKNCIVMSKFSELNIKALLLIAIPMLNLLFMHYFFYFQGFLEWPWLYSEIVNITSVMFDVSVLIISFLIIFNGRFKIAIAITQIITLLWSFVNVMYGKFFFQYLSLSAINEAHGLGDSLVINSVKTAFYWYDFYYLISAIIFFIVIKKVNSYRIRLRTTLRLLFVPLFSLIFALFTYTAYHFIHPRYRYNCDLLLFRYKELLFDSSRGGTPNLAHFQTGSIRVALFELYEMLHVTELTEEQKKHIETYYSDYSLRTTNHQRNPRIKNVIFILLESFLSEPVDLFVDGKEITPFLNSLKRDSDVYYNGNMISDIGCGESSDGQFIYMTGILPLKFRMTVGRVKDNLLPALPIVLKKNLSIDYSEIISPTVPNLWQQSEMNIAYGFSNAFWLEDIVSEQSGIINDGLIFEFASRHLENVKEPFFSLILSLSTHSPYNKYTGDNYLKDNVTLNVLYRNYLNTCHYLDAQIKAFFYSLKEMDYYDNSIIIIASDHYAHIDMMKMNGILSTKTPLFIVNGDINKADSWKGDFHQLDLYTTLLDVLDINTKWRGLGHTIITSSYKSSVDTNVSQLSEWIIEGNYFKNSN